MARPSARAKRPPAIDADGKPVAAKALTNEVATPQINGIRQSARQGLANALTPRRLVQTLVSADDGDLLDLYILAEELELRFGHYAAVLRTRKLAVAGVTPDLEVADGYPEDIADAVRDLIASPNFSRLALDLLDALGKGVAVVEIAWTVARGMWIPDDYRWKPQRWFQWSDDLTELRLRDEADYQQGIELPRERFIIHRPRLSSSLGPTGGLARQALVPYLLTSYLARDMATYTEKYGQPLRVGRYDPSVTKAQRKALAAALAALGSDASAVIPIGMELELLEAHASGGVEAYLGAIKHWEAIVSKTVLGQTMTSDDGSSLAQAKVHEGVRIDIAQADARQLAATINTQLIEPFIAYNFGPQEEYPKVQFPVDEPEDLVAKANALSIMNSIGMQIPAAWAADAFGVPQPAKDEPTLEAAPAAPPADPLDLNRELNRAAPQKLRASEHLNAIVDAELGGWQEHLKGNVGALLDRARSASSAEELEAELNSMPWDDEALIGSMARALFLARGPSDGE